MGFAAASGDALMINASIISPSTNSKSTAKSPLTGSMSAPWNPTTQGCLTRRKSRNSLHKEASSRSSLRVACPRGTFTATNVSRNRPMTTQPKPPLPKTYGGVTSWTSEVPTSQCSLTPTSATRRRAARFVVAPWWDPSRSMSLNTCSVVPDGAALIASKFASSSCPASVAGLADQSSFGSGMAMVGWQPGGADKPGTDLAKPPDASELGTSTMPTMCCTSPALCTEEK
mmetsp:Transcript_76791/g.221883  ORF Transcript_76791/g.221883 Transcript_76791/m.221883 type:complete len:229 (-) Transcript_76791:1088-1774(-)